MNELLISSNKKYGDWVAGDEHMAFDADGLSSGGFLDGFTDYVGNPISVSGPRVRADIGSPFGDYSIDLEDGIFLRRFENFNPSRLIENWTVDYWTREDGSSANVAHLATACSVNPYDFNKSLYTFFKQPSPVNRVGMYRMGTTVGSTMVSDAFRSNIWKHVVVQYIDTGFFQFFVDGIYQGQIARTFPYIADLAWFGIEGYTANSGTTTSLIDRYRFRSGARFNTSGYDISALYG